MPKVKSQTAVRRSLRVTRKSNDLITPPAKSCSFLKSQFNITQLPAEMLLEIFDYLNPSDLLNITKTTTKFSQIVNQTKLAEKFTLTLNEEFHEREWIGSRKYSQLRIKEECQIFGILKVVGK